MEIVINHSTTKFNQAIHDQVKEAKKTLAFWATAFGAIGLCIVVTVIFDQSIPAEIKLGGVVAAATILAGVWRLMGPTWTCFVGYKVMRITTGVVVPLVQLNELGSEVSRVESDEVSLEQRTSTLQYARSPRFVANASILPILFALNMLLVGVSCNPIRRKLEAGMESIVGRPKIGAFGVAVTDILTRLMLICFSSSHNWSIILRMLFILGIHALLLSIQLIEKWWESPFFALLLCYAIPSDTSIMNGADLMKLVSKYVNDLDFLDRNLPPALLAYSLELGTLLIYAGFSVLHFPAPFVYQVLMLFPLVFGGYESLRILYKAEGTPADRWRILTEQDVFDWDAVKKLVNMPTNIRTYLPKKKTKEAKNPQASMLCGKLEDRTGGFLSVGVVVAVTAVLGKLAIFLGIDRFILIPLIKLWSTYPGAFLASAVTLPMIALVDLLKVRLRVDSGDVEGVLVAVDTHLRKASDQVVLVETNGRILTTASVKWDRTATILGPIPPGEYFCRFMRERTILASTLSFTVEPLQVELSPDQDDPVAVGSKLMVTVLPRQSNQSSSDWIGLYKLSSKETYDGPLSQYIEYQKIPSSKAGRGARRDSDGPAVGEPCLTTIEEEEKQQPVMLNFTAPYQSDASFVFMYVTTLGNEYKVLGTSRTFSVKGVSLSGPDRVFAGKPVKVEITSEYPTDASAYVGLYAVGENQNTLISKISKPENEVVFEGKNAPILPGKYQFRFMVNVSVTDKWGLSGGRCVGASDYMYVDGVELNLMSSSGPILSGTGQLEVLVKPRWKRSKNDWVGLFASEMVHTYESFKVIEPSQQDDEDIKLTFHFDAPIKPGTYEFRYMHHDRRVLATSATFTVRGPVITRLTKECRSGSALVVEIEILPATVREGQTFGLYILGAKSNRVAVAQIPSSEDWEGRLVFDGDKAPVIGALYEFRYHDKSSTCIGKSEPFHVRGPQLAVVAGQSTESAINEGSESESKTFAECTKLLVQCVARCNRPVQGKRDRISLYLDKGSSPIESKNVPDPTTENCSDCNLQFNAPGYPGKYQFRYVSADHGELAQSEYFYICDKKEEKDVDKSFETNTLHNKNVSAANDPQSTTFDNSIAVAHKSMSAASEKSIFVGAVAAASQTSKSLAAAATSTAAAASRSSLVSSAIAVASSTVSVASNSSFVSGAVDWMQNTAKTTASVSATPTTATRNLSLAANAVSGLGSWYASRVRRSSENENQPVHRAEVEEPKDATGQVHHLRAGEETVPHEPGVIIYPTAYPVTH